MFDSAREGWAVPTLPSMLKHCWLVCAVAAVGALPQQALTQTLPAQSGPAVATAPATQPAQLVPEAARQAIEASRYTEAASILEPLAKESSASFDVLVNAAGVYDRLALDAANDRTPAGRKSFREQGQKAVEYYLRAAQAATETGDPRAASILERVLRYDPGNPSALLSLARASRDSGSAVRAIDYYKTYIKTPAGTGDYEGQVELGRLLVSQGLWRQAVEVLEKARAVGGADAEGQLALAYLAGKQTDKAVEAANRAVNQPRRTAEAFIVRSSLLLELGAGGRPQDAVDDALSAARLAREAVMASPGDEQVWTKVDTWHQNLVKIAGVLKAQAKPGAMDPMVSIRVAQLISDLGDLSRRMSDHEAVSLLSRAAKAETASVELLAALAERQRDIGQAEAAVATAERVLKQDANNAVAKRIKESGGKPETK